MTSPDDTEGLQRRLAIAEARLVEAERELAVRRQAEASSRWAEERLRFVLSASRIGAWDLDVPTSEVRLSPTCKAIYGLASDADFDHHDLLAAILPEDLAGYRDAVGAAVDGTSDLDVAYSFRMPDGQVRSVEVRGRSILDEHGTRLGVSGIAIDVTERRRTEADLRRLAETLEDRVTERTEELAASNRQLVGQIEERERVAGTLRQMQRLEAVGQLTSGVAHDFNNLLTVIIGNLGFIRRGIAGLPTEEKMARRLGFMEIAAERGAKLTAQLLAFSRRQRLEPKPLDLNATIAGLRDLLQSTMGGAVRVEAVLSEQLWSALVDPTQIELVVLNLAINARDAMEVGGSLTVETSNVVLREPPRRPEEPDPGDYVVVSVCDTGYGMSEEVRTKAFEPFFTTKQIGKGTGLGLSQVLGFAKQSGGGIRIESRIGEGTTVKVYLPRAGRETARVERPCPTPEPRKSCRHAGATILLVDDDTAVREVTAAMLREARYTVIEAGSGGAGLEALDRNANVDLLLVDFAMPGMNGAEVAKEAQARRPGLPTLFVTGYADLEAIRSVGEDRIVAKPFQPARLFQAVDDLLGEPGRAAPQADANVVRLHG